MEGETKTQEVNRLVGLIDRQYPFYPSTFGSCLTEGCGNSARGCGHCAECLVETLGDIVGPEPAETYHEAVIARHKAMSEILSIAEVLDDESE